MTPEDQFNKWFYCDEPGKEGFWQRYTQRYLRTVSKGSWSFTLEKAKSAMKKAIKAPNIVNNINTPEDFMTVCDLALQAQKDYFDEAEKRGKFVPNFKAPATWFNQRHWEAPVGSHSELKEKKEMYKTKKIEFGKKVEGDPQYKESIAKLREMGIKK